MSPHSAELEKLVSMAPGPQRDRLTMMLTDTLASRPLSSEEASRALGGLLCDLISTAERELRMGVAARIASVDWAPRELAVKLALDEIEIARPVIESCKALLEEDLLRIVAQGRAEHRVAVAARPAPPVSVCEAIARTGEAEPILALLRNETAQMSGLAFSTCASAAREHEELHEPLAARPDLPADVVEAVYLIVGEALRARIAARYDVDEASLRRVINAASAAAQDDPGPRQALREAETAALVVALSESGALTADFVLRELINGNPAVFVHAAARATGLSPDAIRDALLKRGAWAAALCCRILDAPRHAFASVFHALAAADVIPSGPLSAAERTAESTYAAQTPSTARDALRRLTQAD